MIPQAQECQVNNLVGQANFKQECHPRGSEKSKETRRCSSQRSEESGGNFRRNGQQPPGKYPGQSKPNKENKSN